MKANYKGIIGTIITLAGVVGLFFANWMVGLSVVFIYTGIFISGQWK